jgi:hypothetical protein
LEISQYQARRLGLPKTAKDALKVAKTVIITGAIDCLYGAFADKLASIPLFKNLPVLKVAGKAKEKLKQLILKEMDKFIDGLRRARRNLILRRRMNMFSKIGHAFKKVGKGIAKAGKGVGKGVVKAGKGVGKGVVKAGKGVGKGIASAAVTVAAEIKKKAEQVAAAAKIAAAATKKVAEAAAKATALAAATVAAETKKKAEQVAAAAKIAAAAAKKAAEAAGKGVVKAAKAVGKVVVTIKDLAKKLSGLVGAALLKALSNIACPVVARIVHHGLDIALKFAGFPPLPMCLHDAILAGCKKGVELAFKRQRILRRLSSLKRELEQF